MTETSEAQAAVVLSGVKGNATAQQYAALLTGEEVGGRTLAQLVADPSLIDAGTVRGIMAGAKYMLAGSRLAVGNGALVVVETGKMTQADYAAELGVSGGYVSQALNASRAMLAVGGKLPGVTENQLLAAVKTGAGSKIKAVAADAEKSVTEKRKEIAALVAEGVKAKQEQTDRSREGGAKRRGPRSGQDGNNGRTGESTPAEDRSKTAMFDGLDAAVAWLEANREHVTTQDVARLRVAAQGILTILDELAAS